jgi:hypothetical protein
MPSLLDEIASWASFSWMKANWLWPVLLGIVVFAYGVYENRRRENLRRKLNDAGLATMLGDQPGAGGALDSFADAELPIPAPKKPPSDQA